MNRLVLAAGGWGGEEGGGVWHMGNWALGNWALGTQIGEGEWLAGGRKIYHWIKIQNSNQSKNSLQKTRLYFGFKKPNKKNPRNGKTEVDSSLFMNSIL